MEDSNEALEDRIDALVDSNEDLEDSNKELKESNKDSEDYNKTLEEYNKALKEHNESLEEYNKALEESNKSLEEELDEFRRNSGSIEELKETKENLQELISLYEENLDIKVYGIYEPHFQAADSQDYKELILDIRASQEQSIRRGSAVHGGEGMTWQGSLTKGLTIAKREKQLLLRAFNGESDVHIASVSWSNISRKTALIEKSYNSINLVYKHQGISISSDYKELKIKELQLAYEYKAKQQQEREEQRAHREQMRDTEKAAREIESALSQAEEEEALYQKALRAAREQLGELDEPKQAELEAQIVELEARLSESEQTKARALSMAQQTKRGHVYIISNIGSLGEHIYKIGMTRRLDPYERVLELGDASVPFKFDTHAMIYAEDAPALEAALHKKLDTHRLNLVNYRREFFRAPIEEIERAVKEQCPNIEFKHEAEATEWRESSARKAATSPPQNPSPTS